MNDPYTAPREHPARQISNALGEHAIEFCRTHLPHGHREGRFWFAGDLHGAPGRALWVRLAPPGRPGRWNDTRTGARGDLLDLLQLRLGGASLGRAIKHARAFLDATGHATPRATPPSQQDPRHRAAAALRLWDLCRPLPGSHAEAYLRTRGINRCDNHPSLRFHPRLFHRDADDAFHEFPALVAALTNDEGELTGVERVYLDPLRPARANVAQPCKSLGRVHGCAVALGPDGPVLIVTQSIETALALRTACPELPAAATLASDNLAAFAPHANASRLLIARDHDGASVRAAERLLERCRRRGITARVFEPRRGDFNDELLEHGPGALAARIRAITTRLGNP